MKKQYKRPELTVARQKQANAKFFVASGGDPAPSYSSTGITDLDDGGNLNI